MNPNPVEIIRKKRDGIKLDESDIHWFINAYTRGDIPDYQMSAFLMSIYFQGMNADETTYLMQAMKDSGEVLDLSSIKIPKVDKHSTGGVGDKVSLILAPLIASCGVCVPMISGRGLGHTGGTLDKLESIPGFRTNLSAKELYKQLEKIGIAMTGQTGQVAPADKKMYALRDVTATVDSIALIAASIMSKKLAEDLNGLVLDVKYGNGAFMREYKKAKLLAQTMVQIGKRAKVKTVAILTSMDSPLGSNVGNSLEVIEAIEALKGKGPSDLMEVTFALGTEMLDMARIDGGRNLLEEKIADGAALKKFEEMIEYQNGNSRVTDDYSYLPVSKKKINVLARQSGFVQAIDCFAIGLLLVDLGGGRMRKEDSIDPSCGFKIHKKTGDHVKKGEVMFEILSDDSSKAKEVAKRMRETYKIGREPCSPRRMVSARF
jgi:pyrimidine-nucleoside phosphorylase